MSNELANKLLNVRLFVALHGANGLAEDLDEAIAFMSGDRAFWTGEAAPVVAEDACGRAPYKHHWQTTPHGHDICVECKQTRATQPAQEAPVWEKPTEWVDERFTIESTGQFNYEVQCYAFTLRAFAEHLERYIEQQIDAAFDARQGEK